MHPHTCVNTYGRVYKHVCPHLQSLRSCLRQHVFTPRPDRPLAHMLRHMPMRVYETVWVQPGSPCLNARLETCLHPCRKYMSVHAYERAWVGLINLLAMRVFSKASCAKIKTSFHKVDKMDNFKNCKNCMSSASCGDMRIGHARSRSHSLVLTSTKSRPTRPTALTRPGLPKKKLLTTLTNLTGVPGRLWQGLGSVASCRPRHALPFWRRVSAAECGLALVLAAAHLTIQQWRRPAVGQIFIHALPTFV